MQGGFCEPLPQSLGVTPVIPQTAFLSCLAEIFIFIFFQCSPCWHRSPREMGIFAKEALLSSSQHHNVVQQEPRAEGCPVTGDTFIATPLISLPLLPSLPAALLGPNSGAVEL